MSFILLRSQDEETRRKGLKTGQAWLNGGEYIILLTYMFKSVTASLPAPHVDPINSSFIQAGT